MRADTAQDLNTAPDSNTEITSTEAEAAAVSAALKLSLLAQEEAQSRDLRLAGNSNAARRPPQDGSAEGVLAKRKPNSGALALFRWLIQLVFLLRSFCSFFC